MTANIQLEKYQARMEQQYNKKLRVQVFEVGQCVGLKIPNVSREKLDDKFILCMVVGKKHQGYILRCDNGLIQGVIATDQLKSRESPHLFQFAADDDVSQVWRSCPLLQLPDLQPEQTTSPHDAIAVLAARRHIAAAAKLVCSAQQGVRYRVMKSAP